MQKPGDVSKVRTLVAALPALSILRVCARVVEDAEVGRGGGWLEGGRRGEDEDEDEDEGLDE